MDRTKPAVAIPDGASFLAEIPKMIPTIPKIRPTQPPYGDGMSPNPRKVRQELRVR